MSGDLEFGLFLGVIIGIVISITGREVFDTDMVYPIQFEEAQKRCAPFGGLRKVEDTSNMIEVSYVCIDGSTGVVEVKAESK